MALRKNLPKREKKVPNDPPGDTPPAGELPAGPPPTTTFSQTGMAKPEDRHFDDAQGRQGEMPHGEFGLQKDVSKIFTGVPIPDKNDAANPTDSTSSPQADTPEQSIPQLNLKAFSVRRNPFDKLRAGKFPVTQKVLLVGIITSASLLTYSLFFSPSTSPSPSQAHAEQHAEVPKAINHVGFMAVNPTRFTAAKEEVNQTVALAIPKRTTSSVSESNTVTAGLSHPQADSGENAQQAPALLLGVNPQDKPEGLAVHEANSEPVSLHVANEYFEAKDYLMAYNTYNKLYQNLNSAEFELVRDFIHLRMAVCLMQKARSAGSGQASAERANDAFRSIAESRSIALKALANYYLCLLEMNSGQYLKARTRAYKTIALTGAIASDYKWALAFERNCQFLAAEAIARQTLSLSDADKELPKQLWYREDEKDPLAGLDEVELQKVLSAGIERFNAGLLAPQIQSIESSTGSAALTRWSVVCNGPGIEELMARFASNAGIDVKWERHTENSSKSESLGDWNRSVVLFLPAATTQQVATAAAGAVGLLAQFNDTNTIIISDPAEYYILSEHTRILNDYSIWLWRKLLLMYSDDNRISNTHFMLGVLQEQRGQTSEAISEYKLVANSYSKTPLAPSAILRSSRLKTSLRDYEGACRDLKQIIEQYPENELAGQAHLNLAETTMKAGFYEQACTLYKKAYNIGLSSESRTIAALGTGKCFYQLNDYESAMKWLNIYLEAVEKPQAQKSSKPQLENNSRFDKLTAPSKVERELYTVYLLLGKANLATGNYQRASEILERTVKKADVSDEYAEAIATLTEAQIKQNDFVTALKTVENVRSWSFSQEQTTRLLLLKSEILRKSGLVEQASRLLTDRIQYLTDPKLKANVTLELGRCEIAANHLELARSYLTDAISSMDPGPAAQTASLELAEVCFKLKDYRQTISICKQLSESSTSEQIKQKAAKILAAAYSGQKDYDKAAMALLTLPARHSVSEDRPADSGTINEQKPAGTTEK